MNLPALTHVEILIQCLSGQQEPLNNLVGHRTDWAGLFKLADQHNLSPLILQSFEQSGFSSLPPSFREEGQKQMRDIAARSLRLKSDLQDLLSMFRENGIPAIPFKGVFLTEQIYPNPALRSSCDLDILLHPKDLSKAEQLVQAKGYIFPEYLTPPMRKQMLESGNHVLLYQGIRRVELHWHILPSKYPSGNLIDRLWGAAIEVEWSGVQVLSLPPEETCAVLMLHGSKHRWSELKWVADVVRLLRKYPDLKWENVYELCSTGFLKRMLSLGVAVVYSVAPELIPAVIEHQARKDERLWQVGTGLVVDVLRNPQRATGPQQIAHLLQFQPNRWAGWKFYLRTVTVPQPADLRAVSLPGFLYPAYYLIRPVRLVLKHLPSMVRRS